MNNNENKDIERLQDPEVDDFIHHMLCPRSWQYPNTKVKCICSKHHKKDKKIKKQQKDLYTYLYGSEKRKHNGLETPGGDSAIDKGCTCPVLDNEHGRGMGRGHFWMNSDCPVHGKESPI